MGKTLRSYIISRERAINIRPILRWIKEAAPREKERKEAAGLLSEIEGIREQRQIILTKGQAEMLAFIYQEFPETAQEPTQLELWDPTKAIKESIITSPGSTISTPVRPKVKEKFTEEEQLARESIGLSRTPKDVPTDASGITLASKISGASQKIRETEGKFGRRREEKEVND